MLYFIL